MTLGILQGVKAKFCPRILGNFPTLFIVLFFPNRPRILGLSRSVTKFKAIGSFGYPVLKALSMPIEGVCALGSAWYASSNLLGQKNEKATLTEPKRLLNTVSNVIDVAGGAIFLRTLITGSAVSPLLGATMGLTSLTSAITLHYIDTK